jgi:hypothetical protein
MEHFNKIYWFICSACLFVFAYVWAITFYPIPADNVRFADTCLGFMLGTVLAGCIAYLVGGNPTISKRPTETPKGTTTAEVNITATTNEPS